ncbi:MAG: replication-associated protein [Genomoviridae sp.]|uniref:replication-associated protein n=1 Tax=Genomoviridae sp. TaxID=2202565 RepID=UPI002481CA13|nr:MAG: replication-associated protein [Genomoviridae sp.]QCW23666.1 MAG: replication-associated protein [Genomoviridae sp.]
MSRFEFRYALFTYSQCGDLEPEAVGLMLSDLGAECIIGREDHADGGIHLHAFAEFQPRLRKRGHVWADVEGFHPNIQPVTKTPWMTYDYAIKDGDVVWGGLERPPMTKKATQEAKEGSKAEAWLDLVNAESSEEFWDIARNRLTEKYVIHYEQMQRQHDRLFDPEEDEEYANPEGYEYDISGYPELADWLKELKDESFIGRKQCLVLYGPSRTGKTQWVRSLGKHVYFGGLYSPGDAVKNMKKVDYAVFDDISGGMEYFHHLKAWFGCQKDISIKRLYREPKLYSWGKPSVWVSNDDPRPTMKQGDADWFNANAVFVEIKSKLFHEQREEPRGEKRGVDMVDDDSQEDREESPLFVSQGEMEGNNRGRSVTGMVGGFANPRYPPRKILRVGSFEE